MKSIRVPAIDRLLTVFGVCCLAWVGYVSVDGMLFRQAQAETLARARDTFAAALPARERLPIGSPVGLLQLKRLDVSTIVVEGDDEATLLRAPGHLPDTPRPWEPGNSAVAGHRDGVFRALKDVKVGDTLTLATPHGELAYTVRALRIVDPDDLSVLKPRERDTLTLIACYPFYYMGPAPKRFIVHAERFDTPPDRFITPPGRSSPQR